MRKRLNEYKKKHPQSYIFKPVESLSYSIPLVKIYQLEVSISIDTRSRAVLHLVNESAPLLREEKKGQVFNFWRDDPLTHGPCSLSSTIYLYLRVAGSFRFCARLSLRLGDKNKDKTAPIGHQAVWRGVVLLLHKISDILLIKEWPVSNMGWRVLRG